MTFEWIERQKNKKKQVERKISMSEMDREKEMKKTGKEKSVKMDWILWRES